jgi:hypothetical protein
VLGQKTLLSAIVEEHAGINIYSPSGITDLILCFWINVLWWRKDDEQLVGTCFITKVYSKPKEDYKEKQLQERYLCLTAALKNCIGILIHSIACLMHTTGPQ